MSKLLIRLAVPMIISMLVTGLYNMADTFFVGQLGKTATAAVGVAAPLMNMINAIGYGFGNGGGVAMSNHLGNKERDRASRIASTAVILCFSFTLIIGVLGLCFRADIVKLLGATDTIAPLAEDYIKYIFIGMPFMAASITLSNVLKYQGNPAYAMTGNMTGAILNIILDPIFISVLGLGVSGAAIATISSQMMSFILNFTFCIKTGVVQIRLSNFTTEIKMISRMLILGLPTFLRQFLTSLSAVILNYAARPFGDEAIAAMTIATKVIFFFQAYSMGIGQGYQPFCGYNHGAKKYSRLYEGLKFCVTFGVSTIAVFCIAGFIFAPQIASLFQKDASVIALAAKALRFQFVGVLFTTAIITADSGAQALGQVKKVLTLSVLRYGVFQFVFATVLPKLFGITGVEMLPMCTEIASCIAAVFIIYPVFRSLKNTPDGEDG